MKREKKTMDYFQKLYRENEDYKQYVDRCAKADKESVEQTLEKLTIREVGRYYAERDKERQHTETVITAGCGGAK